MVVEGERGGESEGEAERAVSHNRTEVGPTGLNYRLSVSVCLPVCSTGCQSVKSLIVRLD